MPSNARSIRIQRYYLRAVTHGMEYWTCPWCGMKNENRLSAETYVCSCTGGGCHGSFYPGRMYVPLVPGRPRQPQDWVVPEGNELRDAFPLGELNRSPYRSGGRIHFTFVPSAQKEIQVVEEFLARATGMVGGGVGVAVEGRGARGITAIAAERELERMREVVVAAQEERLKLYGRYG